MVRFGIDGVERLVGNDILLFRGPWIALHMLLCQLWCGRHGHTDDSEPQSYLAATTIEDGGKEHVLQDL